MKEGLLKLSENTNGIEIIDVKFEKLLQKWKKRSNEKVRELQKSQEHTKADKIKNKEANNLKRKKANEDKNRSHN